MFTNVQVICIAVASVPFFDCRDMRNATFPKIENFAKTLIEKAIMPKQNETTTLQNNGILTTQKNGSAVEKPHHSKTGQPPKRQVQFSDVPLTSVSTIANDKKAYQSPLMVYPFPMLNTYYPRYFPYTYPGYQGYPHFG